MNKLRIIFIITDEVRCCFFLFQQFTNNRLPIIQQLLCHVYQRSLLETQPEILSVVTEVWNFMLGRYAPEDQILAATPWMGVWLSLAMQPSKIPYDHNYLVEAKHPGRVNSLNV